MDVKAAAIIPSPNEKLQCDGARGLRPPLVPALRYPRRMPPQPRGGFTTEIAVPGLGLGPQTSSPYG